MSTSARFILLVMLLFICPGGSAHAADEALRLAWDKNNLTVSGPHLPGGDLKIWYLEAYCRPGSTNRDWKQTKIDHKTRLVSAAEDGHSLVLESVLSDGVIVRHEIRATADEVDFRIVATNPTDKPSDLHWAQPCVRVATFTGGDKTTYLGKCFIFLDGKLARMPTRDWTAKGLNTPGQVWGAKGVNRDDLDPRPVSDVIPDNGLIGCYSADEKTVLAVAFEPYQELFQGVLACIHADFRIGGLKPGETKKSRGKLYIVPADVEVLLKRYRKDFPEHFGTRASGKPSQP